MDARQAFQQAEQRVFEEYGLSPTPRFLELHDPALRTRVLESGEGPPLLFVHGGGGFASQWSPLMAKLPGWRALAVDRPGCGLTQAFDYRGTDLRRHSIAFLGSLLDALEIERLPIVANSMGALWSLFFALEHPDRVSSLALLGCPALFPGTGAPLWLRMFSVRPLRRRAMRLRTPGAAGLRQLFSRVLGEEAAAAMTQAEMESMALSQLIPGASESFGTLIERVVRPWGRRRGAEISRDELRRVSAPTLLVWGRDDPFGSLAAARRGAALLPRGTLEVVEGGHQPWSGRPERCAALVSEFLGA